VIITSYLAW